VPFIGIKLIDLLLVARGRLSGERAWHVRAACLAERVAALWWTSTPKARVLGFWGAACSC
jgi:hypothetical protein